MKEIEFAFIVHPLNTSDILQKFRFMKSLPESWAKMIVRAFPPAIISRISGVSSPYGNINGCFVGVFLTSQQMLELPLKIALHKIIAAGKKAARAGAKIVGLGAMAAVIGDAGITVARNLDIAVTTGNSYTVATALEGTKKAAHLMDIDIRKAEVAVLGATGSIGAVCARILAREVNFLTMIARNVPRLERLAEEILAETGLAVKVTSNVKEAIKKADIIMAVSGSAESLIDPEDLKPGAIICDVARPRDVSLEVAEKRDDVLVIEGGLVEIPGDAALNLGFGFPPKTAYACMAETMILALEKRYENFTLGRKLDVMQVDEINAMAAKHGFKLSSLRSFERPLNPEAIEKIKEKARLNKQKHNF
ncbi:MAG: shikimate dehydrogenase [Firmicutes bacterium]|nr:shikimate dehydrogenase [Bacillota bacterium]